jgi:hypothetical protein
LILELLQNPDQRVGNRRPPHDNFGRPPRNDDDDGDDIPPPYPRGPGAGICDRPPPDVPPTDNTGTAAGGATGAIPSANHLNLTGPALATIRPIVNVEPEEVRDLEPRATAAPPPAPPAAPAPAPAPTLASAQDRQAEATDPDPDYIIPVQDLHAAMKALSKKHATYNKLARVVKSLDKVNPEFSASRSIRL